MTRRPLPLGLLALATAIALTAAGTAALVAARRAPVPRAATAPLETGPRRVVSAPLDGPDLGTAVSTLPAVAPGGTLSVTARLGNRGSVSTAAVLTLTLPATLTVLDATPPFSAAAGRLTWRWPLLGAHVTATLTATLRVPSDAAVDRDLAVAVRAAALGDASGGVEAAARCRVRLGDVRAEIATAAVDARPDETVTWTVGVANVAPVPAEGVEVAVRLDPRTRHVRDTSGATGGAAAGVVRWRRAVLPGPGVHFVDVVAVVDGDTPAGALLAPSVAVTAATGLTRTLDDAATAAPLPVVVPDLWLSALGPLAVPRGERLSWQLRWGNRGGGVAKAIVVTATLPAGTTVVSTTPPASIVGRQLTWRRGDAAPEGAAPIEVVRIDAVVSPLALDEVLTLQAGIASVGRDAAPVDNTARTTSTVLPGAPAAIELTAPATVGVGTAAPIVARVTDAFGAPVDGPTTVRFASTIGALAPADVPTIRGVATTTLTAGEVPGAGRVSAAVDGLTASADVEVVAAALRLTSDLVGPRGPVDRYQVHPGTPLTWTLTVDSGAAAARDVRLVTRLPDRLTLAGVSSTRPITPDGPPRPIGEIVERGWDVGHLAAGERLSLTLRPDVEAGALWSGADLLFARAEITTTSPVGSLLDLVRNAQLRVYAADLRVNVRLDASASSLRPGGMAVYDIAFSNGQPQTEIVAGIVTSTLPAGTRFDHWQAEAGTQVGERTPFDTSSRRLEWTLLQSMASPGALRLWLAIEPDARPTSELVHQVAIGSAVPEIDLGNDVRFDSAYLAGVDLRTAIVGPDVVGPGEVATYTLEVRNAAPQDGATQLTLAAEVPPAVAIVAVGDPGQVTGPGRLRWDFERLGPGGRWSVAFAVRAPADAAIGAAIDVAAEAFAAEGEATPADNAARRQTRIGPGVAATVTVAVADAAILGCAVGATTVTAVARDAAGRPVADGSPVAWQASAGTLVPAAAVTQGGVATATLRGAPPLGPAVVTARVGPAAGQATVAFVVGPPASLSLSASPQRIAAGAASDVAAVALDGCGQVVADGWPVVFEAERGTFDGGRRSVQVDVRGGAARARLSVGPALGALRIAAAHGSVRAETVLDVVAPSATPPPARSTVWLPYATRPRAVAPRSR